MPYPKQFVTLLKACSVLPALIVMPAMAANVTCTGDTCNIAAGDTWDVLTSTGYTGTLTGDGTVLVREGDKTDVFLHLLGDVGGFTGVFASNQHASSEPQHPGNWTPTVVFNKWNPNQTFNLATTAAASGNFIFAGNNNVKIATSGSGYIGGVFLNGNHLDNASTADVLTHIYTGGYESVITGQKMVFDNYNLKMGNLYFGNRGGVSSGVINGDVDATVSNSTMYGIYATGAGSVVHGDVTLDLENVVASDRVVGLMASGGNRNVIDGNLTIKADNVTAPGIFGQQIAMGAVKGDTGVLGDINIDVENSNLGQVRGSTTTNVNGWETWVPEHYVGARNVNIDIEDSVIREEVIAVGNYLSAGNVTVDVSGNTWIGYTLGNDGKYVTTPGADGWIIAGAQRPGGRVGNTTVNLDTDGARNTINIAGDVNIGSRQKSAPDNSDADSVTGNAVLNISGGGAVNVKGDLRAYNVKGDTALSMNNVNLDTAGNVAEFNKISVGPRAVWHNNGALTLRDGAVMTSDGVITGNGTMTIEKGAVANIGVSSVTQDTIVLDGVLNAELRNDKEYATFDVKSFEGVGDLNLSVGRAGTYDIFKNSGFENVHVGLLENSLFDVVLDENNFIVASVKSADAIAGAGLSASAADMIVNMANSSSDALNGMVVNAQKALAAGDAGAVEHAANALQPDNSPIAQSVAGNIQGSVGRLVSARLADMGRKLGDIVYGVSHVWAAGMMNKSDSDGAFNYDMYGFAAGLDFIAGHDITLGAGYAFSTADADMYARNADIDGNTLFVYGQYKPSQWYVNGVLNYTMADLSEHGDAFGMKVKSDRDIDAYGAAVTTGYDLPFGITPEATLRYLHITSDSYDTNMDINVSSADSDFLTAGLGAKYAYDFAATDTILLRPELRAMVNYDIVSQADDVKVSVPGVSKYGLDGERLERLGLELGAGLNLTFDQVELGISYNIDIRRDYTSQTGMLNARYRF